MFLFAYFIKSPFGLIFLASCVLVCLGLPTGPPPVLGITPLWTPPWRDYILSLELSTHSSGARTTLASAAQPPDQLDAGYHHGMESVLPATCPSLPPQTNRPPPPDLSFITFVYHDLGEVFSKDRAPPPSLHTTPMTAPSISSPVPALPVVDSSFVARSNYLVQFVSLPSPSGSLSIKRVAPRLKSRLRLFILFLFFIC